MFSYAVVVCQAHPHPRREVSGFCYSASDDALCRSTAAKFFELPNSNAAIRRQLLATTIFTASAWMLASNGQAYDDPGNAGGGQSTNLHCYCNPRQAITPAAGYTAGAYTPGLSDGRQPCSDWDAVAMTGCEPGISDCNFAGTFTITDSGGNTSTYNIILDVGGAVLNKDCGDPPSSENLTDGSGNVIATVTTHCSSCTIELP